MIARVLAAAALVTVVVAGCSGDEDGPAVIATGATSNVTIDSSADGSVVAVGWYEYDEESGVERALVSTSTDGGVRFGDPVVVAEPAIEFPAVQVLDDGTILVGAVTYAIDELLVEDDPLSWPGWPVIYRSTDGGQSFSLMADLRETVGDRVLTGGMPSSLAASGDGSTIVFAFQDKTPPEAVAEGEPARVDGTNAMPTFAVVSTDGGTTFAPPQVAAPSTCGCCQSSAFTADGRPGVAMRLLEPVTDLTNERNPGINVGDAGGRLGEASTIHDDEYVMTLDGCPASGPGVVEADGELLAAWWTGEDGREGWWFARGTLDGQFGEPIELEAPYTITYSVHIAADQTGQAWVVGMHWPDESGGAYLHLWHVTADGTPTLLEQQPVVDEAAQAYDITEVDGHGLVAWVDGSNVHVEPVGP